MNAEEMFNGVMSKMEANYNPKVDEKHPLMLCIACNSKYTLPMAYEECAKEFRDYCPNCVISALEEQIEAQEREQEQKERDRYGN